MESRDTELDGESPCPAVPAAFERRYAPLPRGDLFGLSDESGAGPQKPTAPQEPTQSHAFRRGIALEGTFLGEVVASPRAFSVAARSPLGHGTTPALTGLAEERWLP